MRLCKKYTNEGGVKTKKLKYSQFVYVIQSLTGVEEPRAVIFVKNVNLFLQYFKKN